MVWYMAAVSAVALVMTVYDKWAARHRTSHRVPEKTLFVIAGLGGSVAMLVTMLLIRHKTRHASFMVGLPLIILAQIALFLLIFKAVF